METATMRHETLQGRAHVHPPPPPPPYPYMDPTDPYTALMPPPPASMGRVHMHHQHSQPSSYALSPVPVYIQPTPRGHPERYAYSTHQYLPAMDPMTSRMMMEQQMLYQPILPPYANTLVHPYHHSHEMGNREHTRMATTVHQRRNPAFVTPQLHTSQNSSRPESRVEMEPYYGEEEVMHQLSHPRTRHVPQTASHTPHSRIPPAEQNPSIVPPQPISSNEQSRYHQQAVYCQERAHPPKARSPLLTQSREREITTVTSTPATYPPAQPKRTTQPAVKRPKDNPPPSSPHLPRNPPSEKRSRHESPTIPTRRPWKNKRVRYTREPDPPRPQVWDLVSDDTTSDQSVGNFAKSGITTGAYDSTAWSQLPQSMKVMNLPYPYRPPEVRCDPTPKRTHVPTAEQQNAAAPEEQKDQLVNRDAAPTSHTTTIPADDRTAPNVNKPPPIPHAPLPGQLSMQTTPPPSHRVDSETAVLPSGGAAGMIDMSVQTQHGEQNDTEAQMHQVVSLREAAAHVSQGPPQEEEGEEETSLLAASINKIRKLEEIMQILPHICEPLHSALSRSNFAAEVPKNWFYVTLTNLYEAADRVPTARLRREDPYLVRCFLEADVNLLIRDARVNGSHVR